MNLKQLHIAVRKLLGDGKYIDAIKLMRQELNIGLKEAKEKVDVIRDNMRVK